jgi:hypothetical protein
MIIEGDARDDLLAAASWYDDQRDGLGTDFLDAVDEVFAASPLPRDRFRLIASTTALVGRSCPGFLTPSSLW